MSDLQLVPAIIARRAAVLACQSPAVRRRILGQPTPMPEDKPKARPTRPEPVRRLPVPRPRPDGVVTKPQQMAAIVHAVAAAFEVSVDDLLGPRRYRTIAWPRQAAMLLMRERLNCTITSIGKFLQRDHTTAIHGLQRAHKHLATNPDWAAKYRRAEAMLAEAVK